VLVTGILDVSRDVVPPGERTRVALRLQHAVGIEPGMRFALREGKKTVGAGVVLSVE
jgi:elongation factor Tu